MKTPFAALAAVALVQGCAAQDGFYCEDYPGLCNQATLSSALSQPGDCTELGDILKANAVESMRVQVMANMQHAVKTANEQRALCGMMPLFLPFYFLSAGASADRTEDTAASGSSGGGAKQYSTTNTQEEGVDEADFLKNDSQYIYVITGGALHIYRAWPAAETALLSSYELPSTAQLMYVFDDRAVVYSYTGRSQYQGACDEWRGIPCRSIGSTTLTVLDIQDRTQPRLLETVTYNGTYAGSRRIGDAVHTTLVFPGTGIPSDMVMQPESLNVCATTDDGIRNAFYELFLANKERLESLSFTTTLPSGTLTRGQDSTALTTECADLFAPAMAGGQDVVGVLSLDLRTPERLALTPVLGQPGLVYASDTNLYVAATYARETWGPWFMGWGSTVEVSAFHKFSMQGAPAATTYLASGLAEGRVLNQFSLGEHNGFLRVATTTGHLPDSDAANAVYVLEPQEDRLEVVGSVEGIAPGEEIRSARFDGERGFVVTFKKTDPLFTVDLSDPRHPHVAGELKVPGFSTYIHMMDDSHLLTIGFDAQDMGDFAWFQGIKLQIFDVSDLDHPRLAHDTLVGTRGSNSEASANHLAFNYFAPLHLLALPMTICDGGTGGSNYGGLSFNGLMVWDVTVEDGFHERGRVSHEGASQSGSCSSWWSAPQTEVRRSIIMDSFVFSLSDTEMKVNHLQDLSRDVAVLPLLGLPTP